MTRKLFILAAAALLVLGCFGCGRSGKMKRGQQQYNVVQEGSAAGVTSTINGPGETTLTATATNAGTTTNLTIPTSLPSNDTADSLPATTTYPAISMRPMHPRTSSADTPVVIDTAGTTTPPRPKQLHSTPPPEQTDTSTTSTDTSSPTTTDTTSTAPPP